MKKKLISLSLLFCLVTGTFNSCLEDNSSITDATRYTSNDVKSYADLFTVFWKVMDQRYNYFYEQKRGDEKDWNTIYKEYYPKFAALKTFGKSTDNDKDINDDRLKASQYFTDIINPIIDRHFYVKIQLPASNNGVVYTNTYSGGMKNMPSTYYPFDDKRAYMKDRLENNMLNQNSGGLKYLAGSLKSNPNIYYFTYNQFALTQGAKIDLLDKYLSPGSGNPLVLTEEMITKSTELMAIADPSTRQKIKDFTINILNQWNSFPNSPEIKTFNEQIKTFKNTEVLSDSFLALTQSTLNQSNNLVKYSANSTYASVLTSQTLPYIQWFVSQMDNHVKWGYILPDFQNAAQNILTRAPLYKSFFNPLHKGDIKKLIIDVRGNGGGMVIDTRFFVDRFITQKTTAYYQRTKEGNGQYNYTPWVPVQTQTHQFGIPKNIPIVILTDKRSASMSEMSTLMLKSQGSHVISIGDYSAGATAGLGGSDDFNGGITQKVADGKLEFYMPLMASKDANGNVIEGVGIKPDIYVDPPTDAELQQMKNSPATFVDRVIDEAVKYLSTK